MLNNATGFKHIYIATGYTDLRKSIDGLAMLINTEFKLNPYDEGSIFLFCGKRNDRIKALVFEEDGFLLMYKRLVDGKYKWPRSGEEVRNITEQQYRWLMEGLAIEQKKSYRKSHSAAHIKVILQMP